MATIATKEQERKALEKIRKIVEELGEGSYVGIALEVCLEMAKENIDNDWGLSEKQLADAAAKRVEELEKQVEDLKAQLDRERSGRADDVKTAETLIASAKKKALAPDDLTDCKQMTENLISELQSKVKEAEATILEYAEHPETTTFCDAVRERKNLTKDISYYEQLRDRLAAKLS